MDKKTECVTFHTTFEKRKRLIALAALEGLSLSELVARLADSHIEEQRARFEVLQEVFESPGNSAGNVGN